MRRTRARRFGKLVGLGLVGAGAIARLLRARRVEPTRLYRYNSRYREYIVLADGTRVRLRLVRPGDKGLLVAAMRAASTQTRYLRFHTAKVVLTESELAYLTEVDGINHLAVGAVLAADGRQGVGIARFVRDAGDPAVAEFAVAVRDDMQRKGLGTALMTRLMEAARERGIRRLSGEVLATNMPALRLFERLCPETTSSNEGRVVAVEMALWRGN